MTKSSNRFDWCWPLAYPATETLPYEAAHPGAFGARRRYDVHTGVDLYAQVAEDVFACEDGAVVTVEDFTGPKAGSSWWHDTQAILVEGETGVILYGEVVPLVKVGERVVRGQLIGRVARVLRTDKGRPLSMLHVELYTHGTRASVVWSLGGDRPNQLRDPTFLLAWAERSHSEGTSIESR